MKLSPEMIQKIKDIATAAYQKIGAADIEKKVNLTLKFATSQPPVTVTLDGKTVVGVAVDIASVFTPEWEYREITDENGKTRAVEVYRALSVVITKERVVLCKVCCDVLPATKTEHVQFVNVLYWTTDVAMLTEEYIC